LRTQLKMREIVVLTCEIEGEGINITAKLKRCGREIISFNASSKYLETLEEELDNVISKINWEKLLKKEGCHDIKHSHNATEKEKEK